MISSAGIPRAFTRLASTKSRKISVQLLKDSKPLGVMGEIVKVKPAFMRNFLHVDDKACYITDKLGPRIPVVTKLKAVKSRTKKPKKTLVPKALDHKPTEPVLSLDDLSSLFSGMRAGNAPKEVPTYEAKSGSGINLIELGDALPQTYTFSPQNFPVTKDHLSQTVFNATGIEVPPSLIRIKKNTEDVMEIPAAGEYTWTFQATGELAFLRRNLRVQ